MRSSGTLPSGFVCTCGKDFRFSPYVYAHWHILLTAKCDCGREFEIEAGNVYEVVTPEGLVTNDTIIPYTQESPVGGANDK
jgi:hypothetical protein